MYLSGINYESLVDGEGIRCTIFVSGCLHNCYQCHSPQTHNFKYGKQVTEDLIQSINKEINKRTFLNGITLSGGDCMYSPQETLELISKIKIPNNNIWCYTGFTIEELLGNPYQLKLLKKIDVLVDGMFDYKKRDITLKFKGSSNQRIIDVKKTLEQNKIVLWNK